MVSPALSPIFCTSFSVMTQLSSAVSTRSISLFSSATRAVSTFVILAGYSDLYGFLLYRVFFPLRSNSIAAAYESGPASISFLDVVTVSSPGIQRSSAKGTAHSLAS